MDYKIVSGYGRGIGSAVIKGVLNYVTSEPKFKLEDCLTLRPFTREVEAKNKEEVYNAYRRDMISFAGIAIFLFGNKKASADSEDDPQAKLPYQPATGVETEFNIAFGKELRLLPVGATGFTAETLWNQMVLKYEKYHPSEELPLEELKKLGDKNLSPQELIKELLTLLAKI